jgi:hypothetical protein
VPAQVQVIPVDGVIELPDFPEQAEISERLREQNELLLLNVATGLSVLLVSVAWVLLALD